MEFCYEGGVGYEKVMEIMASVAVSLITTVTEKGGYHA
jgi:hypothetical protein